MRDIWVASGDSPTVYRYVDWILTVPLQMVEFYLILAAVGVVAGRVFWHLLIGTLIMLLGGYFGETGVLTPVVGFVVGMAGWIYILYYIFSGEAAKSAENAPAAVQSAFNTHETYCTSRLGNLSFGLRTWIHDGFCGCSFLERYL